MNNNFIMEFLNPIAVQTIHVKALDGDACTALFLNHLIYLSSKEEWIYKTYRELYDETGLSQSGIIKAAKKLKKLGILEMRLTGVHNKNPIAIDCKLNMDVLQDWVINFVSR